MIQHAVMHVIAQQLLSIRPRNPQLLAAALLAAERASRSVPNRSSSGRLTACSGRDNWHTWHPCGLIVGKQGITHHVVPPKHLLSGSRFKQRYALAIQAVTYRSFT